MILENKILASIAIIKKSIFDAGVKKEGKGQFSTIYSEGQLLALFRDHANKTKQDLTVTTLGPRDASIEGIDGKLVSKTVSTIVFTFTDESGTVSSTVDIVGVGSDRNDAAFAQGKAMTYSKRYFLLKLLDLASEDIEPDNKDQAIREVKEALKYKLDNPENEAFIEGYKKKYGIDLDINKLSYDKLVMYERQLK